MEESELTKKAAYEAKKAERKNANKSFSQKWKVNNAPRWISVSILLFGALFALWKISSSDTPKVPVPSVPASTTASMDVLTVQADDWVKGNKDARVTVIEYLDFECEACRANYPLVKRLSEEYENEVAFVSRYFPLPGHKNSMTAALAVESAGKQGKYWEMYNLLFEEQEKWGNQISPDRRIFERYAEQLGLDTERFKQDVDSQAVRERVMRDRDAGNKLKVNATPTFFLNGKKIENPRGYEAFKSLIDTALKQ